MKGIIINILTKALPGSLFNKFYRLIGLVNQVLLPLVRSQCLRWGGVLESTFVAFPPWGTLWQVFTQMAFVSYYGYRDLLNTEPPQLLYIWLRWVQTHSHIYLLLLICPSLHWLGIGTWCIVAIHLTGFILFRGQISTSLISLIITSGSSLQHNS